MDLNSKLKLNTKNLEAFGEITSFSPAPQNKHGENVYGVYFMGVTFEIKQSLLDRVFEPAISELPEKTVQSFSEAEIAELIPKEDVQEEIKQEKPKRKKAVK